jgi:uncharacterized protein (DUF1015 family)
MPEIKPFRGILYNQASVNLADVVAPPYDVISPQLQESLYEVSPYNVVRLDFGREEDRYATAAQLFSEWSGAEILQNDEVPAIYFLVQDFKSLEGRDMQRQGFIAICRLEELGKSSVLPHEKTLPKPKEDRLKLLQATHANFSQIFCVYDDAERRIEKPLRHYLQKSEPAVEVTLEGVRNRIWKISDGEEISAIQQFMSMQKVLVADGHHRYETALEFRNIMMKNNPNHTGDEPYNFIMMYFTNLRDKGLTILPTHRILRNMPMFNAKSFLQQLSLYFLVDKQTNLEELMSTLKRKRQFAFGLILAEEPRYHLFSLMSESHLKSLVPSKIPRVLRKLDVTILHAVVFEKILGIPTESQKQYLDYVKDAREAENVVSKGVAQAAFLMNPTPLDQVRDAAETGHTMPQKSTYFYPKLLSGLVMHSLDND